MPVRQITFPVLLGVTLLEAHLPARAILHPAPQAATSSTARTLAGTDATQVARAAQASSPVADCPTTLSLADAAQLAEGLPRTSGELLQLLSVCGNTAKMLISDGQLGLVHLPAMLAKDIAIVLEGYTSGLTERQKVRAANAAKRLVVAAWKLITYGDLRNREQLLESYDLFAAAIADIIAAYGAHPSQR